MTKISKAVIAAAGRGTRFLPAVKSYPKELVPILSKPNLQYLVEELVGANVTDICIVYRKDEEAIKKYFSPDIDLDKYLESTGKTKYLDGLKEILSKVNFTFIPQPENLPYGNGSPLIAAKDFVGQDNFVYMFGDDLTVEPTPGAYLSEMISTFEKYNPAAIIASQEVPWTEISRYGSIQYMDDVNYPNRIAAVLEKMPPETAPSNFAQGGRYILSYKVIDTLLNQRTGKDNELWLADANNYLAHHDVVLTQSIKNGEWMTTGDTLRWLKANIVIALMDPSYKEDLSAYLKSLNL